MNGFFYAVTTGGCGFRKICDKSVLMISVIVILEVDSASLAAFLEAVREQSAASLHEPGCHRFEVSCKLDKENVFTLSELYSDQAALDAHYASAHFALWRERIKDIPMTKTAVRGEVIAS